jgi:hypothetical protein
MDKLAHYREIIRRLLREYGTWKPSSPQVASEIICDTSSDHFELKYIGWDGNRRVHSCVFHLDIIDGKIWVQFDGTNRPVAEELVRAGIPKEDIVLAEKPVEVRPLTGYGVG